MYFAVLQMMELVGSGMLGILNVLQEFIRQNLQMLLQVRQLSHCLISLHDFVFRDGLDCQLSAGKATTLSAGEPSSSMIAHSHQILCCAYNANGTVFVTGSSDTFARVSLIFYVLELLIYYFSCQTVLPSTNKYLQVWNACKSNAEDPEQPVHEMDILSGHENDVNYVQFRFANHADLTLTFLIHTDSDSQITLKMQWMFCSSSIFNL